MTNAEDAVARLHAAGHAAAIAAARMAAADLSGTASPTDDSDGTGHTIEPWHSTRFSLAGAALALAEKSSATLKITAAVAALAALLTPQINAMVSLRGEAVDTSIFTGGHWPRATAEAYSDATVTDGDAEWSFAR